MSSVTSRTFESTIRPDASGRSSPISMLGVPICQSPRNSTCEDPDSAPIAHLKRDSTEDGTILVEEPEGMMNEKASPKSSQDSTTSQFLLSQTLSEYVKSDLLVAICPGEAQRYERRVERKEYNEQQFIDPYKLNFAKPGLPPSWNKKVAFDGAPYFFKRISITDSTNQPLTYLTVMTDNNMCDDRTRNRIEDSANMIVEYLKKHNLISHINGWHLTLELRKPVVKEGKEIRRVGYYFVDHKREVIFWFDKFDASDMDTSSVRIQFNEDSELIGHEIQAQYWNHNDAFPGMYPYNAIEKLLPRLQDELVGHMGELLLAPSGATTPWDESDITKFLSLCKDMKALGDRKAPIDSSSRVIFRLLYHIEHERFLNLYGEENARLDRRQSLYGDRKLGKTWFMLVIAPLLFFAPNAHLHTLQDASVDGVVRRSAWNAIAKRFIEEWKEHVLYSTVLLNANVAFLTIQSIDDVERVSPIQILSYLSICVSIGAVVVGLILARQHATTIKSQFLANRSASQSGLETLAIMYSLPYALLIWGMISFFMAFAWMCYSKFHVITTVILSIALASLLFAITWCISASYENKPYLHLAPMRAVLACSGLVQQGYHAIKKRLPSCRWRSSGRSNMDVEKGQSEEAGS